MQQGRKGRRAIQVLQDMARRRKRTRRIRIQETGSKHKKNGREGGGLGDDLRQTKKGRAVERKVEKVLRKRIRP